MPWLWEPDTGLHKRRRLSDRLGVHKYARLLWALIRQVEGVLIRWWERAWCAMADFAACRGRLEYLVRWVLALTVTLLVVSVWQAWWRRAGGW